MSKITPTQAKKNVGKLLRALQKLYPEANCALEHQNPFQLLIATILSAQCTDARVNMVTPSLFKEFPTPEKMAQAKPSEIEGLISSTGFFRQKAKSLLGSSKIISDEYGGEVPRTMEELNALPGVGRKTANVVMGNAFGKAAGIVVDTHVKRLSNRMGLTKQKNPEKIELELNKLIPQKHWINLPHWLITHGRQVCDARKPKCNECSLLKLCPRVGLPKLKEAVVKKQMSYKQVSS
jgi:endonuclease-3